MQLAGSADSHIRCRRCPTRMPSAGRSILCALSDVLGTEPKLESQKEISQYGWTGGIHPPAVTAGRYYLSHNALWLVQVSPGKRV